MKFIYYIFLILLTGFSACDTKKQRTSEAADSTAVTSLASTEKKVLLTDRLIQLSLTADSHWRGLNLGEDFGSVLATEKNKPFEQNARHVGYAVDLPNLESMDVLYAQQNEKLSAITADLYLNNRPNVDAYQKDLSAYFTARYGAPKTVNGSALWKGTVNEQIKLTDVSKGKDYGLNVSITSVGTPTASVK